MIKPMLLPFPQSLQILDGYCESLDIKIITIPEIAPEAYELHVTPEQITMAASTSTGISYAQATLAQLQYQYGSKLPCLIIKDSPAFSWRGLHLDVSRHFFSIEYIKKLLTAMAAYKLNRFHWHLTDDQGWRIQIDKYPLLTETGAWRLDEKGQKYGGFYTKDEIKEVVAFAKNLHIEIIPEIEMPGHALAAIAAYHQYSCKAKPISINDNWGVFDQVFCLGKAETITFLKDILTEVCELFPSPWLHTGGDECPTTSWEKCPSCVNKAKDVGLESVSDLQKWFTREIALFLHTQGKAMIGWDEILGAELPPDSVIMVWRGDGIDAIKMAAERKHQLILTPNLFYYFDWKQLTDEAEFGSFGVTTLSKTYSYNPLAALESEADRKLILGVQGNIWTERITCGDRVSYMAFPRVLAIAETGWTHQKSATEDFIQRAAAQIPFLRNLGIKPCEKIE
jgi:hexosaminidase